MAITLALKDGNKVNVKSDIRTFAKDSAGPAIPPGEEVFLSDFFLGGPESLFLTEENESFLIQGGRFDT